MFFGGGETVAEEIKRVNFMDDGQHCWIDGKQWISLDRLYEIKHDNVKETRLLIKKVEELTEENKALKVLLKDKLKFE